MNSGFHGKKLTICSLACRTRQPARIIEAQTISLP